MGSLPRNPGPRKAAGSSIGRMVRGAKSEASKLQGSTVFFVDVVGKTPGGLFVVKRQLVVFYGLFLKAIFLLEKSGSKMEIWFWKKTLKKNCLQREM